MSFASISTLLVSPKTTCPRGVANVGATARPNVVSCTREIFSSRG